MKRFVLTISAIMAAVICLNAALPISAADDKAVAKSSILTGTPSEKTDGEANKVEFRYPSADAMFNGMTDVAKSGAYQMKFDPKTAAVALKDLKSGSIYTTNPYAASNDNGAVGDIEKSLESQIVVSYVDINSRSKKLSLYSSSDCIELGQYSYMTYENGIKFSMAIGKQSANQLVPPAITVERFDELTAKMDERAKTRMGIYYTLYSLSEETDEEARNEMLKQYPTLSKQDLYISVDLSEREKKEVDEFLTGAGYTLDAMNADLAELNTKDDSNITPSFSMDIEYALTGDGIKVNIPNSSIKYDKAHYQLLEVSVLQYFGADTPAAKKDGYLFIPDGSGAVINFNDNDDNRRTIITSSVYGFDAANEQQMSDTEGQQTYLPVYGIRRNDNSAFTAIIESGDSVSEITAKLGQPNSDYYTAYTTFQYAMDKQVEMDAKVSSLGSKSTVYLYEKTNCEKDFTISYHTLSKNNANYSGMAQVYRSYLINQGMKTKQNATDISLNVNTLGTSLYTDSFFGFDYQAQAKYTTYSQNQEILDYFRGKGVDKMTLTLSAWQKYGLDSMVSNDARVASALGGVSDFKNLLDYTTKNNIAIYPDTDMLFVTNDRWFDGFSANSDSIRQLDYTFGGIADYDFSTQKYINQKYAVTPSKYETYFDKYFGSYKSLDCKNISLGSLGTYLNSNYSNKDQINRSKSLETISKLLKQYSADYNMSFTGANAYTLPYASNLQNIPTTCSQYLGESYSVPFLQMVVSGCMTYNSESINLNEDGKALLLRCVETHTSPSFIVAKSNVQLLKNTDYNKYYAVNYEVLKEQMASDYAFVSKALEKTDGATLTAHEKIADNVFCSTYSNGVKVYVNYGSADYTGTVNVKSMNYAVA